MRVGLSSLDAIRKQRSPNPRLSEEGTRPHSRYSEGSEESHFSSVSDSPPPIPSRFRKWAMIRVSGFVLANPEMIINCGEPQTAFFTFHEHCRSTPNYRPPD